MQHLYLEVENLTHRQEVVSVIEDSGARSVLDIGASWNPYLSEYVTHVFDKFNPHLPNVHWFGGDLNDYESWEPIFEYVEQNGKFDFINCTHVLEDLAYPQTALKYMPRIGKRGFIAVPSKYWELQRRELMRGGHHHRWIMDSKNNVLTLWPKINLIEYMTLYDQCQEQIDNNANKELRMFWSKNIKYKVINDDYLGPSFEDVVNYYEELMK